MNVYGIPFGKTGGEAFGSFDMSSNVAPTSYDPSKPLFLSFDFNVVPYMTLKVFQIHDLGGGKYQVQGLPEICPKSPKNNTLGTCKEFIRHYPEHEAGVFVTGDPSGKARSTRQESGKNDFTIIAEALKQYNPVMRHHTKAPSVVPRIQFMNSIFEGLTNIQYIEPPENRLTIRDFMYVKEAADGTKAKKKVKDPDTGQSYEKYGHTSDATEYFFTKFFEDLFKPFTGKKGYQIR